MSTNSKGLNIDLVDLILVVVTIIISFSFRFRLGAITLIMFGKIIEYIKSATIIHTLLNKSLFSI